MIKWFIKKYPNYVKKMKNCSYHYSNENLNYHHLEENVWAHTMMSYNQGIFNDVSKYVLWALLLHDIGRVATRSKNKKKDFVDFGDFEGVSCYMALEILNKTDLNIYEKSRILKIISYHYTVIDYIKYDDPPINELYEIFKYEDELLQDLASYVKCDLFGRVVDKSKAKYYDINKCNDFIVTTSSHNIVKNDISKTMDNEVYILVGPPCSGKSTWIEKQNKESIVINRDSCVEEIGRKYNKNNYDDSYHLMNNDKSIKKEVNKLDERREELAKNSKNSNIIIDNPNLTLKNRKEWIDAFKNTHTVKIILFLIPFKELVERDKLRFKHTNKSINKKGFKNKLKTFSFPLFGEGFDEIEVIPTSLKSKKSFQQRYTL